MYCRQNPDECNIIADDGSRKRDIHLTLRDWLKRYNSQLTFSCEYIVGIAKLTVNMIIIALNDQVFFTITYV